MSYTFAALIGAALAVGFDLVVTRAAVSTMRGFWACYAIVFAFQLMVNGVLTGLPVVSYRRSAILGPRVINAPVEDIAFGFALILTVLSSWMWLQRRPRTGRE